MRMTWGINEHPLDGPLPNILAIILVVIVAITACLCIGATSPTPKYWQDLILKPEQAWIEAYGYNNESVLAYNVARIIRLSNTQGGKIQSQDKEIQSLKERVLKLEVAQKVNDPNDVEKEQDK